MKIFIATGIYPPDIGGPAEYAKHLKEEFLKLGHRVAVKSFRLEKKLPTGLRHLRYFFRVVPSVRRADVVFALDTFSACLPALCAARIFGKKFIIRTGGDFLWESFVERTGDLVLLREFYKTRVGNFSLKEGVIFRLTKWILHSASAVIFSTEWQREIWSEPYKLSNVKNFVVENYYGRKELSFPPIEKNFLAGTRPLKWKNDMRLKEAFARAREGDERLVYDNSTRPFKAFMDKLARSYAVTLVSLGDVSPNLILDAIRHNKPFILTRETGLYERVKDCAIFADPESVADIAEKIHWLLDEQNYNEQKRKVEQFSFTHTWKEIAEEFLKILDKVKSPSQ